MKKINNYILEKFKISNDVSVPELRKRPEKLALFTDLYQVGDRCLLLYCFTRNRNDYVKIDIVEITRILKTKINYKKITDFSRSLDYNNGGSRKNNFEIHFSKASNEAQYSKDKFISSSGMNHTKYIVPEYEVEEILNKIEKENYKIDFYKELWGNRTSSDWPLSKVIKLSPKANLWENDEKDYIQINHEDIVALRKAL